MLFVQMHVRIAHKKLRLSRKKEIVEITICAGYLLCFFQTPLFVKVCQQWQMFISSWIVGSAIYQKLLDSVEDG